MADVTTTSIRHSGLARRASTVARGGPSPGESHASETSFIPSKSVRSARKICTPSNRDVSVPARCRTASTAARTCRVWPRMSCVTDPQLLDPCGRRIAERLVPATLHVRPVDCKAILAGGRKLRRHTIVDGLGQWRIVEHDVRCQPAQFERHALLGPGGVAHQHTTHLGNTGASSDVRAAATQVFGARERDSDRPRFTGCRRIGASAME